MKHRLIALSLALAAASASAQNMAPLSSPKAPGLYVQVLDGTINVSNGGGSMNYAAGQFGFTPSQQQPPVILPSNPGMQFSPPPAFNSSAPPSATAQAKPGAVDCLVR